MRRHRGKVDILAVGNRHSIVILVVALAIFGVAVAYAGNQIDQGRQSYLLAKTRVASSDDLTRKHLDDQAFLEQYESAFLDWHDSGKIGPVDEVDWVELLLDAGSNIGAEHFRHRLDGAESLSKLNGRKVQLIAISQSDMNLDFEAQHGADVFHFFKEIRERAPGPFMVNDLKIERIEDKVTRSKVSPGELKLSDDVSSSMTQTVSLPILNRRDLSFPEGSTVFGGVKVTAILRWFQIELAD